MFSLADVTLWWHWMFAVGEIMEAAYRKSAGDFA
jgi:hypothetical protein